MKTLLLLGAVLGLSGAAFAAPTSRPIHRATTTCDFGGDAWIKDAANYLHNGKVGPGKRPAIWATVTLVGTGSAEAVAGQTPDRTLMWYCFGEVTADSLPNGAFIKGTLPMWLNFGPDDAPFDGGQTHTLILAMQNDGQTTFQYQISGRNRLGQGPKSIPVSVVASGTQGNTLMLESETSFFGPKVITISLVKGEANK